jgi:protoporphyrinogen oxidase
MLSTRNAPEGAGSIQAEVYFSEKYKPFTGSPEDYIEPVIRDLKRVGLVKDNDRILSKKAMFLKYANIIFDLERAEALKTVHGYLDDVGIAYCGRYGDWGYMWTDESFISGEKAAEKTLTVGASSR